MITDKPQIAIIQFPGSNCERETTLAVTRAGMQPVHCFWNTEKEDLLACDGFIIVGGFSYEDRCRSGAIAALDSIIGLLKIADAQGKPILGICNGAQILVESMLVPNVNSKEKVVALANNQRVKNNKILGTGFYNNWVYVKNDTAKSKNIFLKYIFDKILHIPTAHGEGRFIFAEGLYEKLLELDVGSLKYCDADGELISEFPINPNGSQHNIAAIGNISGNILAIMPHPERTENGDLIFCAMRDYIKNKKFVLPCSYDFNFPVRKINNYTAAAEAITIAVKLLITDNEALSVKSALVALGYNIDLTKYIFWEIEHTDNKAVELKEQIIKTWELLNPNKEVVVDLQEAKNCNLIFCREKEDLFAEQKLYVLKKYYNLSAIKNVKRYVLWQIKTSSGDIKIITDNILQKYILAHPLIHEVYCNV